MVKAKAGSSAIHRLGLVAQEFIPAGTVIWRFEPGFDLEIPNDKFQSLSPTAQEQVLYYAYFDEQTRTFVLSSDDDRLTNHSDDPNTRSSKDFTYAVRDIQTGEEITCNYEEIVMVNFRRERFPSLRKERLL